jgi:hypothetical protein
MSKPLADSLFKVCKICGEDYSESKSAKSSLSRHLRFKHPEIQGKYSRVTSGYLVKHILDGKVPKCKAEGCKNKVTIYGFEYLRDFCSAECSSAFDRANGGKFTDSKLRSEQNKRQWKDPDYVKRLLALRGTPRHKEEASLRAKNYWAQPGIKESRSKGHKSWWVTKKTDKAYMKMRSEASSKNASKLLRTNPNFGYGRAIYYDLEVDYRGVTFRSTWEVAFAKKLDDLNVDWEYEIRTFKISNGKRYTPDFYLPKLKLWVEVKPKAYQPQNLFKLKSVKKQTEESIKYIDNKGIKSLTKRSLTKASKDNVW